MDTSNNSSAVLAGKAVGNYLRVAMTEIDSVMGAGYATANPVLLAGFIQAMTLDREIGGVKDAINSHGG
jgi:hypothetical protein